MEVMLKDNGLKEFIDNDFPKAGKGEEESVGGSMRPHCLKPPWESHTICYVEGFDGYFLKQQRP